MIAMKPLESHEIRGNWATLLLPVNTDESIDYGRLQAEIDYLVSLRVNGIYSNGTAGEFYNQTEEEFDKVNSLLADACNAAGVPFQVGCNHMSPVIALERVKRAVALSPGAIQVILPDWYPPTMEEVISYLRVMAEAAAPIGLVLYNPPHAKVKLAPEAFRQIREAGIPLAGCKLPGGDEQWYKAMQQQAPHLSLFIPGHHLATGIRQGAHGAYSNVACLHPGAAQQWYNDMVNGQMEKALELQSRIQLFMNECIVPLMKERGYAGHAMDKLMAAVGGWAPVGTRLRWPYRSVPESAVAGIRKRARALLPEFFFT
jgi:dihydrodipicolinate synthase/N-acetylneuraminate lyase